MPTTIEALGNYKLLQVGNHYEIESLSGQRTSITYAGSATAGPNSFADWLAVQVEVDTAGGYQVLWRHTNDAKCLWHISNGGELVSAGYPSSDELTNLEIVFRTDLNGDGLLGPAGNLILV